MGNRLWAVAKVDGAQIGAAESQPPVGGNGRDVDIIEYPRRDQAMIGNAIERDAASVTEIPQMRLVRRTCRDKAHQRLFESRLSTCGEVLVELLERAGRKPVRLTQELGQFG